LHDGKTTYSLRLRRRPSPPPLGHLFVSQTPAAAAPRSAARRWPPYKTCVRPAAPLSGPIAATLSPRHCGAPASALHEDNTTVICRSAGDTAHQGADHMFRKNTSIHGSMILLQRTWCAAVAKCMWDRAIRRRQQSCWMAAQASSPVTCSASGACAAEVTGSKIGLSSCTECPCAGRTSPASMSPWSCDKAWFSDN